MTIEQDRYRELVAQALLEEGVDPTKVTVAFDGDLGDHWPEGTAPPSYARAVTVYTTDYLPGSRVWYSSVQLNEDSEQKGFLSERLARLQAAFLGRRLRWESE